jgi:nicotinamide-nucleotide amidase
LDPEVIAKQIGEELKARKLMFATAESCTGGWVGQVLTSVPGSSHWYDRGFITYTNNAKRQMLGVSTDLLARYGAVSEQTARAMAQGALERSDAQVSLAITGIAGPGGGTPDKPVGTVCFAWSGENRETLTRRLHFEGERQQIRSKAVTEALSGLLAFISDT